MHFYSGPPMHILSGVDTRSQNATLAPSATKRLTVASPIPDAPPVTAATLPSSLPLFATFHCIAKRASTIRRTHPAGTAREDVITSKIAGSRAPEADLRLRRPRSVLTRSWNHRLSADPG